MTATRSAPAASRAVAPIVPDLDFTALLQSAGMIEFNTGSTFNRVSIDGAQFRFGGEDIRFYNAKTDEPAFRGRLIDLPVEYQAAWIDNERGLATALGRPGFKGYCRSHFEIEGQKREFSEDGTACRGCPISPFVKKEALPPEADGKKCSWKADAAFQLLDADGKISDDRVWTLSMTTTGVIEFKGTSREPEKGSATELTFMQKLVRLGASLNPADPNMGALNALNAVREGRVLFEARSIFQQGEGAIRYYVPSFTPYDILAEDEIPALPSGEGNNSLPGDDLPF